MNAFLVPGGYKYLDKGLLDKLGPDNDADNEKETVSLKLDACGTEPCVRELNRTLKVAAVVPAYNEETRITAVLNALIGADAVTEIVVVSDGSTDRTCEVAGALPKVRAIQLPTNRGKGGAMKAGALLTDADVLIFFDADLTGLTPQHVQDLLTPVCSGEATMSTGVLYGARFATDIAQAVSPGITGQRAILRDIFMQIPDVDNVGYGIELAINYYVLHNGYTRKVVRLRGVSHPVKEEKLGWIRGIAHRCKMYWQMLRFRISYELHGRPPKNRRKPS